MKKIILSLSISILLTSIICPVVAASQQKLSLTATASSFYGYRAGRAVDGDYNTYWIGGSNQDPWWISFDTEAKQEVNYINIKWYSTFYTPINYTIQISDDGATWENVFTGISGTCTETGETRYINREARYIRLYITQIKYYFPVIREVEVYSSSAIPHLMRFQGNLKGGNGLLLDGAFTLTFRLYDAKTGGTLLWEEVQTNVNIENGLLDVELGSITPLDLPFNKQYWLGVEVESDGEMVPRFKLTTVPYSFMSAESK